MSSGERADDPQRQKLDERLAELAEQNSALREAGERERQMRRRREAEADRLGDTAGQYRAELIERESGIRYRLGDAFVRAARPSMDTLKLPWRIIALLWEGCTRRRARRQAAKRTADNVIPPALPGDSYPTSHTPQGYDPESCAVLTAPFTEAPRELRQRDDVRVCVVCDEFSWRAWQFEADCRTCMPNTWQEVLEQKPPDVLLIESTWRGAQDSWRYQLYDPGPREPAVSYHALPEIVAWCRQREIPTVFYNKEDPPNFEVFIEAARQFDHVFTSDANCLPDYHDRLGHERVYALPFAAQPRIHNPLMSGPRAGNVCFAGTWYAHRHFARHADTESILRPALDYDLHIYDRMANSGDPNYRWPEAYQSAVRGALPYGLMLAAYKRYKVFLNVNSVKNSPTMFARRVYELLACGTPVISSYSEGIEELLGTELVPMSTDESTTRALIERLLGDDDYRRRLSLRGQRAVFSRHTYTERFQSILDAIGLQRSAVAPPVLTMIAAVEDATELAAAWANYRRQTYTHKQLIICTPRPAVLANLGSVTGDDQSVRGIAVEGASWGALLREALQSCVGGFGVALNPADYYGAEYLTDYAHATLYVFDTPMGKAGWHRLDSDGSLQVAGTEAEYRFVERVHPWTLCLSATRAAEMVGVADGAGTPVEWWDKLAVGPGAACALDHFNYVQVAEGAALDGTRLAAALV
ncbi:MAG: glycosyltransferase [Planctomycetota bacterium]